MWDAAVLARGCDPPGTPRGAGAGFLHLGAPAMTPAEEMPAVQAGATAAVEAALAALELTPESPAPGSYLVRLEGQRKLATMTWLIVGAHSLHVEAFFCRQPDENHARFYRFLLERNGRMYGVHFAVDERGDVYLTGRLPLASVSTEEIDRVLGCVLSYSDDNFNSALAIGFESSIRREWAWRIKRGESTANLTAFAQFAPTNPSSSR
jgi:Putative bacterial sensory transduction regulator